MKVNSKNVCEISFLAVSENEAFARMVAAAFVMPENPTLEELSDIKTAVSEAVTNAILHGYNQDAVGMVHMRCEKEENNFSFCISDAGVGIENGDGTSLYIKTGTGAVRHGIFFYGGFYGHAFGGIGAGKRNKGYHVQKNRN